MHPHPHPHMHITHTPAHALAHNAHTHTLIELYFCETLPVLFTSVDPFKKGYSA